MKKKSKWIKRIVIILAITVVAVVLLLACLFPPYDEPVGSGTHTVKTDIFTWVDESRVETFTDTGENRSLTVGIWYPEEEGSYPLVIFSQGAFGIMESEKVPFTWTNYLGIALMIGGVIIFKWKN